MVIEDQELVQKPEPSVEDLFFERYRYGFCALTREGLLLELGIPETTLERSLHNGMLRELVGSEKNLYHLRRPDRIAGLTDPNFKERLQKNVDLLESIERKDYFILERIFLGEEINYTLATSLDSLKKKRFIEQDRDEYFLIGPLKWVMSISYGEEYAEPVEPSRSFPECDMIPVSPVGSMPVSRAPAPRLPSSFQAAAPKTRVESASKQDQLLSFFVEKLSQSSFYIQNPGQIAERVPHEKGELGYLGKCLFERGCITYQFGIVMPTDRLRSQNNLPALKLPLEWDATPQAYVALCFLSDIHPEDEKKKLTHYSLIKELSHRMNTSGPSAKQAIEFLKERGYFALTRDGLYFPPSVQTMFEQAPLQLPSPQPHEPARKEEHEDATPVVAPTARPTRNPYGFNANQALVLNAIRQLGYKVTNKKLSEATRLDPDYVSGIMKGFCRREVLYTSPQADHVFVQFHPDVEASLPKMDLPAPREHEHPKPKAQTPLQPREEPDTASWSCKGKRLADYLSYMETVIKPAMEKESLDPRRAPTSKWLQSHGFGTFYNGIAITKHLEEEGVSTYTQFVERAGYQPNKAGRAAKA